MNCYLLGADTLLEHILTWCQLEPLKQTSRKFKPIYKSFHLKNAFKNIVCKMSAILFRWCHVNPDCISMLIGLTLSLPNSSTQAECLHNLIDHWLNCIVRSTRDLLIFPYELTSVDLVLSVSGHDDVKLWEHSPHYWSFVRGIHGWPVNFPHKGISNAELCCFLSFDPENIVHQTVDQRLDWRHEFRTTSP